MSDKPATPGDGTVRLTPAAPKAKVAAPVSAPGKAKAPRITGAGPEAPAGETVKKADFVDRVVARSGIKKKDAKPAIEATLAEIAAILGAGGELVLPPIGKLKTVKINDLGEGAQVMTLKLRTMKAGAGGAGAGNAKSGVAEDGDDS